MTQRMRTGIITQAAKVTMGIIANVAKSTQRIIAEVVKVTTGVILATKVAMMAAEIIAVVGEIIKAMAMTSTRRHYHTLHLGLIVGYPSYPALFMFIDYDFTQFRYTTAAPVAFL